MLADLRGVVPARLECRHAPPEDSLSLFDRCMPIGRMVLFDQ